MRGNFAHDLIPFRLLVGIPQTLSLVALTVAVCVSPARADDPLSKATEIPDKAVLFSETIDVGIVFVNEEFVPPPYRIEATADVVTVNGIECLRIAETAESDPRERFARDRRRERWPGDMADFRRQRAPARAAEQMAATLGEGGILVASGGVFMRHLTGPQVFPFCDAMLSDPPSDQQISRFVLLAENHTQHESWEAWLLSFKPSDRLRTLMQPLVDEMNIFLAAEDAQSAALRRLDALTYPLTIAGMLLGVFALGHVLKWTARSIVAEQSTRDAPELIRCVEVALLLMLAMSSIDLVWTILAGQAGVMREVNPLASSLIQSPLQLVFFKVAATGLGCGILYALRQRKQVQDATWWMCLVCVLLTFRWVVFDSVIA